MIGIKIEGLENFNRKVSEIKVRKSRLQDELGAVCERAGQAMVTTSKANYLSGPRPGKLGVVTGRLRSSILSKVERTGTGFIIRVGTNVEYGPIHEYGGTVGKARIPKRPFVRPAIIDNMDALENRITQVLKEIAA